MSNLTKEKRRQLMPECTKFIDEFRSVFGELNYIKAEENGHSVEWRKTVDKLPLSDKPDN